MKKYRSILINIAISVGAIGFLGWKAAQEPQFWELVQGQKDWSRLGLAAGLVLAAVTLTILRWRLLVQTLELPLSLSGALRIGFISYLFNLLPLGLVGGDGLKAYFISQLHPENKTKAVATVLLDRVIGLAALLMFAAVATLLFDRSGMTGDDRLRIDRICLAIQIAGSCSALGLAMFFVPGFTTHPFWDRFTTQPKSRGTFIDQILTKLIEAMRLYRQRGDRVFIAVIMSLVVHTLYVCMLFLVGSALLRNGLPTPSPTFGSHFVIGPLAMTAGALPLGGIELILDLLYRAAIPSAELADAVVNKGFLMALVYRLIQILVGIIGAVYYLVSRNEIQQMMQEAKQAGAA